MTIKPHIVFATAEQLDCGELPAVAAPRPKAISARSEDQERLLAEWRDAWQKAMRGPTDRALGEAAARACYRLAKLPLPKIIWRSAPQSGGISLICWHHSIACVSYLIDGCGLDLGPDLEFRHRVFGALAKTCQWVSFSDDVCLLVEKN